MGFKLKIVTPEKVFFEGEVDILNIKLTKGYTGILPKHMPLVSMVEIAPMNFKQGKITKEMAVHGGVLNVKEDETLLLVNAIEYKEDIDIERAKKAEERARQRLENHDQDIDIKRAKAALNRALVRNQVYTRIK